MGRLIEAAKRYVYDAATKGEVERFKQLLQEDPYLLNEVPFAHSRNLLHIAALSGQLLIVEEVLQMNPELAREVDSKKSSPLHIAAARGDHEIAMRLVPAAPEMCRWRDDQGMNPVHLAAVNGHPRVLSELFTWGLSPAMERLHRGETVLHLCVKHGQLMVLDLLVEKLGELVCAKDDDGETILHLAVRCNRHEIIQYLVEGNKIKKETTNSLGKTALDILNETPSSEITNYSEMKRILMVLSKKSMLKALPKLSDTTMVVVVLIATMAFQAAVSPPGGVWQEDTPSHRAGDAVMASTHPKIYKHFVRANTTAFVSSLVTIFLVTTRQPSRRIYFLLIAVYATWASLASIAVSYGASIMVITPNTEARSLVPTIIAVVVVSISIFGLILVYISIRRLYLSWKSKHEDLRTVSPIKHVFYAVFELLDARENLQVETYLASVLRGFVLDR